MITCHENGQIGFTSLIFHSLLVLVCLIYWSFLPLLVPVVSLNTIVRNHPLPPLHSSLQQIINYLVLLMMNYLFITKAGIYEILTIGIIPTDLCIALRI